MKNMLTIKGIIKVDDNKDVKPISNNDSSFTLYHIYYISIKNSLLIFWFKNHTNSIKSYDDLFDLPLSKLIKVFQNGMPQFFF